MGVSKVVFHDTVKLDLTADTISPDKMLAGTTAHNNAGERITGTINKVSVALPVITVQKRTGSTPQVSISATIDQKAGAVSAQRKTSYNYLDGFVPSTILPSTEEQVIVPADCYTFSDVVLPGEPNLIAENIKSGITIFGITGTCAGSSEMAAVTINNQTTAAITAVSVDESLTIASRTSKELLVAIGGMLYVNYGMRNIWVTGGKIVHQTATEAFVRVDNSECRVSITINPVM